MTVFLWILSILVGGIGFYRILDAASWLRLTSGILLFAWGLTLGAAAHYI